MLTHAPPITSSFTCSTWYSPARSTNRGTPHYQVFLNLLLIFFFLRCNIFFSAVIALYQDLTHWNQKSKLFIFIASFVFLQACGKTKNSGPNGGKCGCNMIFYYPRKIFQSDDPKHPKFAIISKDLFPLYMIRVFMHSVRETSTRAYLFQHLLLDQSPYKRLIKVLCFFYSADASTQSIRIISIKISCFLPLNFNPSWLKVLNDTNEIKGEKQWP